MNYFDEPATFSGNRYWDGAIAGLNNPVLVGVTEAVALGIDPSDIRALSLGTGTVHLAGPPVDNPPQFVQQRSAQSVVNDLEKLAGCITDDPPDAASYMAHVLTGGPAGMPATVGTRVIRMNPMLSPRQNAQGNWVAPGSWTYEQFEYLTQISMDALDSTKVEYISEYAQLWISGDAPNQPLRMDVDTLALQVGQADYPAARAAWGAIR